MKNSRGNIRNKEIKFENIFFTFAIVCAKILDKAMKETNTHAATAGQGEASSTESALWKRLVGEHSRAERLNLCSRFFRQIPLSSK